MPKMKCLYSRLFHLRGSSFILTALVLLLAIIGISHTTIENNGLIFIPDSRDELKIASRIMASSPGANILFVDVEGEDALAAAKAMEDAVPPEIATSIGRGIKEISPETIIRAIPFLFGPDAEKMLNGHIGEKGVLGLLDEDRKLVQGFGAIALSGWVRTDPLQFRKVLAKIFPEQTRAFGRTLSEDGHHALVMFKPNNNALNTSSAKNLVEIIKSNTPANHVITMSGAPLHTAANAEAVERDLFRIIFFSLAGFAATYIFLARSWGALWILFTAIASTVTSMGMTGFVWPATSGIALGFGASLMGLAEDYAVHMHFALRSGNDQEKIYCSLDMPLFKSFLLNSAGFIVLFFSSVPVIRQMAFFAVISLLTGYCLALGVLPFIKNFTLPRNIHETVRHGGKIPSIRRGIIACLALLCGCVFFYARVDFNFSPRILGADAEAIAASARKIHEIWNTGTPSAIVIEGSSRDDALRKSLKYAARLRDSGAKNVMAPSDYSFPSDTARENAARWKDWLENSQIIKKIDDEASRAGFTKDAFTPFMKALKEPPLEIDAVESLLMNGATAIIRFEGLAGNVEIDDKNVFIFSPREFENEIIQSFGEEKRLVFIAAIIMFFLICVLLRKPGRVLASFVPPLFSVLLVFSIFALLKMPFTLASLAVLPIVFGLSIDHGVMITHSQECGQAMGVRRAVIMASITAFFSIGLLAISSHPVLRSMGIVIFAGLAGELFAALWLVPLIYPTTRTSV